jgi:putative FmdB family regulatory protein
MPLYDYECDSRHRFEAIRSINEPDTVPVPCPTCGEKAVRDSIPRVTHSENDVNVGGSSLRINFKWRPY